MQDNLTPAELAEGLRLLGEPFYRDCLGDWFRKHGESALRELAALRTFRAAIQEAALRYDDPRNYPVTTESGLVLYHAVDAAIGELAALDQGQAPPEGPRITAWGATSRHIEIEWLGERIEIQRGASGRWLDIGQGRGISDG